MVWVCLALFSSSFLLGSSLQLGLVPYQVLTFPLLGLALLLRGSTGAQVCLALASIVWGLSHGAPSPSQTWENVTAVQTSFSRSPGYLIVSHNGAYYSAQGSAAIGDRGLVLPPKNRQTLSFLQASRASYQSYRDTVQTGLLTALATKMKTSIQDRIVNVPSDLQALCSSLILGDSSQLQRYEIETFKVLGLFHALVVSGFHITAWIFIVRFLLASPLLFLYTCRVISPSAWPSFTLLLRLLCLLLLLMYVTAIGFPPSAQRAFFIYLIGESVLFFGPTFSSKRSLTLGAALLCQAAIFPFSLLSLSSFLSWTSYLLVLALLVGKPLAGGQSPGGFSLWKTKLSSHLKCQGVLTLLVAGLCGQLSLIGMLSNLLCTPLFPFVFITTLILLFPSLMPSPVLQGAIESLRIILEILHSSSNFAKDFHLYFDLSESHKPFQLLALFISFAFFLNIFKTWTMSSGENAPPRKKGGKVSSQARPSTAELT